MSTIRTLTAIFSERSAPYPTYEELLSQYDVEIPMEEMDFENDQE